MTASSTSPSRVLRSMCSRLGRCICTGELAERHKMAIHGANLSENSFASVSVETKTVVTKNMSQQEMETASHFEEVASRRTTTHKSSAIVGNNRVNNHAKRLHLQDQSTRTGKFPVAKFDSDVSCFWSLLKLGFWVVLLSTAFMVVLFMYMNKTNSTVAEAFDNERWTRVWAKSTTTLRIWYYRLDHYLTSTRWVQSTSKVPGPDSVASGNASLYNRRLDSSEVSELRLAVTNLERRVSTIADRMDQKAVETSLELEEASSLVRKATATIETQLTDRMNLELAQLRLTIDNLKANIASQSLLLTNNRKAADDSREHAKRLERLEQQLAKSLRQQGSRTASSAQTYQKDLAIPEADLMPDYALLSGGARVISTHDSKPYGGSTTTSFSAALQPWRWFGWWQPASLVGPDTVLTPRMQPGACWSFTGFPGRLLVKLSHPIRISAVSIDHLSKRQSYNNSVASAPREFSVYGLATRCVRRDLAEKLGNFTYDAEASPTTQTFHLAQATRQLYQFVELEIHSNHGKPEYSCLYRFRVHGHMS